MEKIEKTLILSVVLFVGAIIGYSIQSGDAQSMRPLTFQEELLLDIRGNVTEINTKISILSVEINEIADLENGDFNSFSINGVTERFFVKFVNQFNATNDTCIVFDRALQLDNVVITCLEPFASLSQSERDTYNSDFTLP